MTEREELAKPIKNVLIKYRSYSISNPGIDYQDFAYHEILDALQPYLDQQIKEAVAAKDKSYRELVVKVKNPHPSQEQVTLVYERANWEGFEDCRRAILAQLPPEQEAPRKS